MSNQSFPCIDLKATGANINSLRRAKGYSVRDLQEYFGFAQPQAIYKWQWGETLPSVDNLYALSILLETPMNDILVSAEQSADFFMLAPYFPRHQRPKPTMLYSKISQQLPKNPPHHRLNHPLADNFSTSGLMTKKPFFAILYPSRYFKTS